MIFTKIQSCCDVALWTRLSSTLVRKVLEKIGKEEANFKFFWAAKRNSSIRKYSLNVGKKQPVYKFHYHMDLTKVSGWMDEEGINYDIIILIEPLHTFFGLPNSIKRCKSGLVVPTFSKTIEAADWCGSELLEFIKDISLINDKEEAIRKCDGFHSRNISFCIPGILKFH